MYIYYKSMVQLLNSTSTILLDIHSEPDTPTSPQPDTHTSRPIIHDIDHPLSTTTPTVEPFPPPTAVDPYQPPSPTVDPSLPHSPTADTSLPHSPTVEPSQPPSPHRDNRSEEPTTIHRNLPKRGKGGPPPEVTLNSFTQTMPRCSLSSLGLVAGPMPSKMLGYSSQLSTSIRQSQNFT